MKEYSEVTINGDIPKTMKLVLVFIDRVGFPVLAFCLMFWMSFISLQKATDAITLNTQALLEFRTSSKEFQSTVVYEHGKFSSALEKVYDCCTKRQ